MNKGKQKTTGNASHSNFKSGRKTLRQMKMEILEEKCKPLSKNSQGKVSFLHCRRTVWKLHQFLQVIMQTL